MSNSLELKKSFNRIDASIWNSIPLSVKTLNISNFRKKNQYSLMFYIIKIISLACVRATLVICNAFFARGVVTYIGYIGRAGTFWSEIRYGSCTLVLNWVCFLEEATSSSLDDKIISLLMFTPTLYVP